MELESITYDAYTVWSFIYIAWGTSTQKNLWDKLIKRSLLFLNPMGQGTPGLDGRDGLPGEPGLDGIPGRNGLDGIPGMDGIPGLDGLPGKDGRDGKDGELWHAPWVIRLWRKYMLGQYIAICMLWQS